MASNSIGHNFRITTWGESHGKAIGVVIDGCPAKLPLSEEDINKELRLRRPGRRYTSPRQEKDEAEILSGVFEGQTTGAPISIIIWNRDIDSSGYEAVSHLLRPGHAQYTYLKKYGIFDFRGGGRASARETACRVAAGAIAKKWLRLHGIEVIAYVKQVGDIIADCDLVTKEQVLESAIFCPDPLAEEKICQLINALDGDSIGGVIEMRATVPAGLGSPTFEKLEANLAKAMLSIPAAKGFEIGDGFACSRQKGSEHNDLFGLENGEIALMSNHAGGTLGGISTGQELIVRVPFKPTSSIQKPQQTVSLNKEDAVFASPGTRHDPCVALRAAPVVEAMGALVLADALTDCAQHVGVQADLLSAKQMKSCLHAQT